MARNDGFSTSGTRSCKYCPARVCDAARSGESKTSILTWKSDSAAGSIPERGACVQTVVSCHTAAATVARRRMRWCLIRWFGARRRRTVMERRGGQWCAWGRGDDKERRVEGEIETLRWFMGEAVGARGWRR